MSICFWIMSVTQHERELTSAPQSAPAAPPAPGSDPWPASGSSYLGATSRSPECSGSRRSGTGSSSAQGSLPPTRSWSPLLPCKSSATGSWNCEPLLSLFPVDLTNLTCLLAPEEGRGQILEVRPQPETGQPRQRSDCCWIWTGPRSPVWLQRRSDI